MLSIPICHIYKFSNTYAVNVNEKVSHVITNF